MYAKRGGVAAYHIVWIGLCFRSVPGVRVLASKNSESVHVLVLTIDEYGKCFVILIYMSI